MQLSQVAALGRDGLSCSSRRSSTRRLRASTESTKVLVRLGEAAASLRLELDSRLGHLRPAGEDDDELGPAREVDDDEESRWLRRLTTAEDDDKEEEFRPDLSGSSIRHIRVRNPLLNSACSPPRVPPCPDCGELGHDFECVGHGHEAYLEVSVLPSRQPSTTNHLQSPFQLLYNKLPSYHHLRVFGCSCYPWLRPYAPHKFASQSTCHIFLGYSPSHKGYKCLHPITGKILISRHVVFDETSYPYRTSSTVSPPHQPLSATHRISLSATHRIPSISDHHKTRHCLQRQPTLSTYAFSTATSLPVP